MKTISRLLVGPLALILLVAQSPIASADRGEPPVSPQQIAYAIPDKGVTFDLTAFPGETISKEFSLPVTYVMKNGETRRGTEQITLTLVNSSQPVSITSGEVATEEAKAGLLSSSASFNCVADANTISRSFRGAVNWSAAYGYQWWTGDYEVYSSASWPWTPGVFGSVHHPSGTTTGTISVAQIKVFSMSVWPYLVGSNIIDWTLYTSGGCGASLSFSY